MTTTTGYGVGRAVVAGGRRQHTPCLLLSMTTSKTSRLGTERRSASDRAGGEATDLHLELLPSIHFQLGRARRTRVDLAAGRADAAAVQVVVAVLPFLQQAVVATTDG